ncbi:MAG: hypothetical protein ACI88H_001721, partial [Cocleimonas sp.]
TVFSDTFEKLAERQSGHEVIVSFSDKVDKTLLTQLEGVAQVETLTTITGQSRFCLHYQNQGQDQNIDTHYASEVFELAVKQGWNLVELSPQTETLEQIFMDLVYSESKSDVEQLEAIDE